jgi:hypothetical protein
MLKVAVKVKVGVNAKLNRVHQPTVWYGTLATLGVGSVSYDKMSVPVNIYQT